MHSTAATPATILRHPLVLFNRPTPTPTTTPSMLKWIHFPTSIQLLYNKLRGALGWDGGLQEVEFGTEGVAFGLELLELGFTHLVKLVVVE